MAATQQLCGCKLAQAGPSTPHGDPVALGALGMGEGVLLLMTRPGRQPEDSVSWSGPSLLAPGCRRVGKPNSDDDDNNSGSKPHAY